MTESKTTLREQFEQHLFEEDSPPLSKEEKITVDCFIDFLKEKGVLK
jgi:hypothetical protein